MHTCPIHSTPTHRTAPTLSDTTDPSLTARVIGKQDMTSEEEELFAWFLRQYRDTLAGPEETIADLVESGQLDPSSLEALRAQIEPRIGDSRAEFELLFREGGREGAEVGRAVAARRLDVQVAFDAVPADTLEAIDEWAEAAASSTMETITEDAARWLRGAHEEGLDIDDIADVLNEELFEGRLEDHVARRAARTGTHGSAQQGRHSVHEEADGVVAEQWLTNIDGRERASHADAHQQVVGVGNTFELGNGVYLAFPGDPSAPIGEIIHCRCDAVGVFADQLTEDQLEAIEAGERITVAI